MKRQPQNFKLHFDGSIDFFEGFLEGAQGLEDGGQDEVNRRGESWSQAVGLSGSPLDGLHHSLWIFETVLTCFEDELGKVF